MGYVHNTSMSQVIPPHLMSGTVAAWAIAAGTVTNTVVFACDATDEVAVLTVPIPIPSNSVGQVGSYLKSIEIDFEILTAALDVMTATIRKLTRGGDGNVPVMSTLAFTYDSGHDSAAERIDIDQHQMKLTLDDAVWIDNDVAIALEVSFDKAGTSIVQVLLAIANYTARM